ncbi:MAG: hypothetical protein PHN31_04330 [Candidatus Gracilibacteria bacterium]|nr:hypothetical protein [Candidatus Gracilibacteria bacterium]
MDTKKIQAVRDFIINAEKSIKNAKKILKDLLEEQGLTLKEEDNVDLDLRGLTSYSSNDYKIVEGVFTGEEMLGVDGHKYPVPVNYASKSKLVQGDRLKLTIDPSGKMMYKQIKQIERESKVGLLTKELGKFQVIAEGQTYNVLTAAVTHFRAEIGDSVSIIVPVGKVASFAAIESVIPKV